MFKKISVGLLCASSLLCGSNAFSANEHILSQGLAVEYQFPPNSPQVFSNIFFWTIKASCTVTSNTPNHYMAAKMLSKTGSVNGQPLNAGDETGLMSQPGDVLQITADPGAKVELTNRGTDTITASCTTVG